MFLSLGFLIIGLALITKGADFFVDGAAALAKRFKIPEIIVGLTIVAMGTSAPEAGVSIMSAIKGAEGVAIGNIIGSNIANIFLILGVTSLICALPIKKNTIKYEIPFVALITVLLLLMGCHFSCITRMCALILAVLFITFLTYLFKMSENGENKENTENDNEEKKLSIIKMIIFIIGGILALVYGSDITVNSAVDIARRLNISDRIIGLTMIAIGTSLPELVTCAVAAFKKQADLAIGNIIGSNIFNILFVLGITALIKPVPFDKIFIFDGLIALLAVILLYLFVFKSNKLNKIQGFIFLVLYFSYMAYIVLK